MRSPEKTSLRRLSASRCAPEYLIQLSRSSKLTLPAVLLESGSMRTFGSSVIPLANEVSARQRSRRFQRVSSTILYVSQLILGKKGSLPVQPPAGRAAPSQCSPEKEPSKYLGPPSTLSRHVYTGSLPFIIGWAHVRMNLSMRAGLNPHAWAHGTRSDAIEKTFFSYRFQSAWMPLRSV